MKLGTSQVQLLNDHLRGTGRTITTNEAYDLFGIENLSARMSDLRDLGLVVNLVDTGTYSVSSRDINGSRAKLSFA